jgi:hypothetical protein
MASGVDEITPNEFAAVAGQADLKLTGTAPDGSSSASRRSCVRTHNRMAWMIAVVALASSQAV